MYAPKIYVQRIVHQINYLKKKLQDVDRLELLRCISK